MRKRLKQAAVIAPVPWLMAQGVAEGRMAVNFSEWADYSPEQQRSLLAAPCEAARGRANIATNSQPQARR